MKITFVEKVGELERVVTFEGEMKEQFVEYLVRSTVLGGDVVVAESFDRSVFARFLNEE